MSYSYWNGGVFTGVKGVQYCKPQVLLGKGYHFTVEGIRKGYLFSLLIYERVARRASTFIPEMTCIECIARLLNLLPTFTANIRQNGFQCNYAYWCDVETNFAGGCCMTKPEDIVKIREVVDKHRWPAKQSSKDTLYRSVLTRLRHCSTFSGNAALKLAQGVLRGQRRKKTTVEPRYFEVPREMEKSSK